MKGVPECRMYLGELEVHAIYRYTRGIYALLYMAAFGLSRLPSPPLQRVLIHIHTSVSSKCCRVAKSAVGAYGTADAVRGGLATSAALIIRVCGAGFIAAACDARSA